MAAENGKGGADIRLVVGASSAGTVFEWYDFFIYASIGASLKEAFFKTGDATLETLVYWLVFAVGFGFRPLGAVLFGYLGDKLGRKYTFLVTVTLMGIATAGVGLIPPSSQIGIAAPILVIVLRILQGLALGGEYGGAAVYVAEHSAPGRRGYFTSYIQASVVGGFVLSLIVVLSTKWLLGEQGWADNGWRIPFLVSLVLLAISLWMRLKLTESPVFAEMKEQGELAGNPFVESMTYPGNRKRLFVALFGVAAGLTVIWYTAMFTGLTFLTASMRVEETTAQIIVGVSASIGMVAYLVFGHLSDRIGRKKPIVIGYAMTLLLLFPAFWMIGGAANPGLAEAAAKAPIVVSGNDCDYSLLAPVQPTRCGKLLSDLSATGAAYTLKEGSGLALTVGGTAVPLDSYPWDDKAPRPAAQKALQGMLAPFGYDFGKVRPDATGTLLIGFSLLILMALSGATYGPVAALLTEMFPARIRYSSMSIPYHIGTGYFGGFLPFISSLIVARTGNPYSGLWYTWIVVAMAFAVAAWGLRGGPPRDFDEQDG